MELQKKQYRIKDFIRDVKYKKLKVIIGELDKITPISEVEHFLYKKLKRIDIKVISGMDHDYIENHHFEQIHDEIQFFFSN